MAKNLLPPSQVDKFLKRYKKNLEKAKQDPNSRKSWKEILNKKSNKFKRKKQTYYELAKNKTDEEEDEENFRLS